MSWRISSQRGSSSSASSSGGWSARGRRVRLFRYIRFAAIKMNSAARSMFSMRKVSMYWRYCAVMREIEMLWMSTSSFLIR